MFALPPVPVRLRAFLVIVAVFILAACAGPVAELTTESGADSSAQSNFDPSAGLYPSKVSVKPGESLDFHISNGNTASFTLSIYREGGERRLMGTIPNVRSNNYSCAGKYDTGCDWPATTTFTVPNDWPTGIYTVDMPRTGGQPLKTLFFVRPPRPTARILFLTSINTYQAYNDFGGGSLYGFGDSDKGTQVSFNRPYFYGTGFLNRWEGQFVTWAENAGYDMDYAATYDLEFVPGLLDGYDVVIVAGHSEYWTYDMRGRLKAYIAGGGRFMNLSGNTMWWQVRFEDNGRTMIGYKNWRNDPQQAATQATDVNWDYPIYDGSFSIVGLHWPYGGYPGGNGDGYYAVNAGHWIFRGAGVSENELFGKGPTIETSIHDKESDGLAFNCGADGASILGPITGTGTPANFTILGLTPVNSHIRGLNGVAVMGLYTVPGGGAVFSAGTTGWMLGLNQPAVDRITRNVIDRFLAGDFPQEPAAPDSDYLFIDRFNCNALNRNRFSTPIGDAARLNYISTKGAQSCSSLMTTCGVDGSGLSMAAKSANVRFVANLRPNWATVETLHTRVYLNLKGFKVNPGALFTLMQHANDNRVDNPAVVAELQIGRVGNGPAIRYQPAGANWDWIPVPANGFFRVDTVWDATQGIIGITVNGDDGYERQVDLRNSPRPNRADFGALAKKGTSGGKMCIDELIYDDRPITAAPFAVAQ